MRSCGPERTTVVERELFSCFDRTGCVENPQSQSVSRGDVPGYAVRTVGTFGRWLGKQAAMVHHLHRSRSGLGG